MRNKIKALLISKLLIFFQSSCQSTKEALQGKKRSNQNDEFLVKKKNPLEMPPDFKKLPRPGDDLKISKSTNQGNDIKELLKIEQIEDKNTNNSSSLIDNILKKID